MSQNLLLQKLPLRPVIMGHPATASDHNPSKMEPKAFTCCATSDTKSQDFQVIHLDDCKKPPAEQVPTISTSSNFPAHLRSFFRKAYGLPVCPEESKQRLNFMACITEPTLETLSQNIDDLLDYGCHDEVLQLLSELDVASDLLPQHKLLTAKTRHHLGDLNTAKSLYLHVHSKATSEQVQMFEGALGVASIFFSSCQYTQALRECQDLLGKLERLPEESPTLRFKATLLSTSCLIKLSNFKEAEEQIQSMQESVQPNSRQWAQVQNLAAVCQLCQGEYNEAFTKFNQIHLTLLALLGHDHLETIGAAINASTAQRHLGQRVQAMQVLNQARTVLKHRFAADHPAVLQSGICKLELLVELGKLEQASKLIKKLDLHPIPSPAMKLVVQLQKTELQERSLYATKMKAKEEHELVFAKCQSAYLQVLRDTKEAFGHQNRLTLRVLHNFLVFWTRRSLAAQQTLALFEKLLALQSEVLGENHPDVVLTNKNIEKCQRMIKLLGEKANNAKCSDVDLMEVFD